MAATPLTTAQLNAAAKAALKQQAEAQDLHHKRPFSALLLAPDNETVLLNSNSLSHVRHAESELARNAADNFDWAFLARCTLVSTWEPCAMCAGAIYWAHIGRLVYLASEETLRGVVGDRVCGSGVVEIMQAEEPGISETGAVAAGTEVGIG